MKSIKLMCRKSVFVVLLIFLALSSTTCVVVSLHPIIDRSSAKADKSLRGKWVSQDKDLEGIYALFDGEASLETNILAGKGELKKSELMFEVSTGKIGKHQYMSLKPQDEDIGKGYLLVKYVITRDELKVWLLDETEINSAISEGLLKSERSGGSSDTTLTDSPRKIAEFIESKEDRLFAFLGTFKKMKGN